MNFDVQRAGKGFKVCKACGHPVPEKLISCDNRRSGKRCDNTDLSGPHKRYRMNALNELVCIDEE